ncbi:proteasome maturation factor ump1 [Nannochloropsis oceanica]
MSFEMDLALPVLKEPVDQMREGIKAGGFQSEATAPHPVQAFQATRKEREFSARLDTIARLYGVAAAMRMKTEADILSQICRAPGLPSSFVGLETVLGTDETVEFEDVLNDPQERPDLPMVSVHEKMEARLGL